MLLLAAAALLLRPTACATDTDVPLQELLQLLRTNTPSISPEELEEATVEGLLARLKGKVRIVRDEQERADKPLVSGAGVFDNETAHIRVGDIREGLATAIQKTWKELISSNRVAALVLDLRNASGNSLEEAAASADLFLNSDKPIFKAGARTFTATKSNDDIRGPLAILVNNGTSGAAEALAGALRVGRSALIFGAPTAGAAREYQRLELSNGVKVEIAAGWIEFPNGQTAPEKGITPDVLVLVDSSVEQRHLADPFWSGLDPAQAIDAARGSNTVSRRLLNEAELMRRQRGEPFAPDLGQNSIPSKPVITDPVLARGVDFLKGALVFHKESASR